MNSLEKKEKKFSISAMISTEIVLLYLVLMIGDAIAKSSSNTNWFLTRYIPIAIVSLVITFFLIKSGAKKTFKSNEDLFRKQIMIVPIIVAVIILLYGFYSVKINVNKFNQKYEDLYNRYSVLYDKYNLNNSMQTQYKNMIEDARKQAKNSWIITSIVYFVSSMITTLFMKNKIYSFLKDDEVYDSVESTNTQNAVQILDDSNNEIIDDNSMTHEENNNTVNDIKWDL